MTRAMTRVLILDLDEDLRGALHQMLTTVAHYAVTEVTTEAAALEFLTEIARRKRRGLGPSRQAGLPGFSPCFFASIVVHSF